MVDKGEPGEAAVDNVAVNRARRAKVGKILKAQQRRRLSSMRFSQIFLGTRPEDEELLDVYNHEITYLADVNDEDLNKEVGEKEVIGLKSFTLQEALAKMNELEVASRALRTNPADTVAKATVDRLTPEVAVFKQHASREIATLGAIAEQQATRQKQQLAFDVIKGEEGAAAEYLGGLSPKDRRWHQMRLAKATRNAVNNANREEQRFMLRQEVRDTEDRAQQRRQQVKILKRELGGRFPWSKGPERELTGETKREFGARILPAAGIGAATPVLGQAPLGPEVLQRAADLATGLPRLEQQLAGLGADSPDRAGLGAQIADHKQQLAAIRGEQQKREADATVGRSAVDAFSSDVQRDRLDASRQSASATKAWKISEAEQRVLGLSAGGAILTRLPGHFLNGLKYAVLAAAEAAGHDVAPKEPERGKPRKSSKKPGFTPAP